MGLSAVLTTFLVAFIGALIPVVPIAIGLLKTYLQVQQNKIRLNNRPTHDQVAVAIEAKAKELLANGNGAADEHNWRNHRVGDSTPPGNT